MTKSIRYYSLLDGSGYGDSAINYMEDLLDHGVNIRWSPLVSISLGMVPVDLTPESNRPVFQNDNPRRNRLLQTVESGEDMIALHHAPF